MTTPIEQALEALKSPTQWFSTCPCRPLFSCHTAQEVDQWWMTYIRRCQEVVVGNVRAAIASLEAATQAPQPAAEADAILREFVASSKAVDESLQNHTGYDDAVTDRHRAAWTRARTYCEAAPQPAPVQGWRPIAEAPKDGYFLVHEDGAIRALLRHDGKWEPTTYPAIVTRAWGDVIVGEAANRLLPDGYTLVVRDGCCEEPTHWMPLPPAPNDTVAATVKESLTDGGEGSKP